MRERVRSRNRSAVAGLWQAYGGSPEPGSYLISREYMRDFTDKEIRKFHRLGGLPPTNLYQEKADIITPPIMNYRRYQSTFAHDLPVRHNLGYSDPSAPVPGFGSLSVDEARQALANSNPFRYGVSVPVMLAEIAELGTLFKLVTSSVASMLGSGYLSARFGLMPFVADIQRLNNIVKQVRSRIGEFNSLIEHGHLRRRVPLSSTSYSDDAFGGDQNGETPLYTGLDISVYAKVQAKWSQKTWASVTWAVRSGQKLPVTELDDFISAVQYYLDLDQGVLQGDPDSWLDASTLWEAIPFSWLLDYFTNVGESLQALEESETVAPYDICVMRTRKVEYSLVPQPRSWWNEYKLSCTKGNETHEVRERVTFGDDPSLAELLQFGIMNDNQALNVLALLAVLRGRGRGQ